MPTPTAPDEVLVDVLAVGLHPRVRSQANGTHYTSTDALPLIPGVDGVGRGPDGQLRYFIVRDEAVGTMAEQAVIDLRRSIVLPDRADPVRVAAAMNPAMSSWIALRRRIDFREGQHVLVLGATGNAGRLAISVAKRLGASVVIGAGRNPDRLGALADLGADATVSLEGAPDDLAERLGQAARDVDVVIDYLWGQPTADAMRAVVVHRADPGRPLSWIEVGSVAGSTASIPSAALRAARLQLVGSGQGSVTTAEILAELPALAQELTDGPLCIDARTVPLEAVESAWRDVDATQRVVVTPSLSWRPAGA